MARTNNIQLFKTYIDQLDDVYKYSSKTAVLESNAALVKNGASASEFIVPKIDMDGLGDYSRREGARRHTRHRERRCQKRRRSRTNL